MLLSLQMDLSLFSAAAVYAALDCTSVFDPSTLTVAPRSSLCFIVSRCYLMALIMVLTGSLLFVMSFVFSALITIPCLVEISSELFTSSVSSSEWPASPSIPPANQRFVKLRSPLLIAPECLSLCLCLSVPLSLCLCLSVYSDSRAFFISDHRHQLAPPPSPLPLSLSDFLSVCPSFIFPPRASVITHSRKMLKSAGERRQPWRTSTDVWNQSPTVP